MANQTYTAYMHTTPERLWDALTTPEQTVRYFDFMEGFMAVDSSWTPGSPVTYRVGEVAQIEGRVIEVERPARLVTGFSLLYYPEEERDTPSRMVWEIAPIGEVCNLTVTWSGEEAAGQTARDIGICMPSILANLKILLETGRPRLIKEIVFDCADPARLSVFWAAATGYVMQGPPPTPEDNFVATADPHGVGPELAFQRVPEHKVVKNRVHFDLRVDDPATEIERLLTLGARRAHGYPHGVLLDPEGNEFCVGG
ncbi:MAG: SRPBCC domain-containing protein [Chloroflexia bacterium]|nr:SRPBCC domain-containing protein [Chloroflexia bacterium]